MFDKYQRWVRNQEKEVFDKSVLITTRIPRSLYDQIVLLAYHQGDGNVDKLIGEMLESAAAIHRDIYNQIVDLAEEGESIDALVKKLLEIGIAAKKGPDADGDD